MQKLTVLATALAAVLGESVRSQTPASPCYEADFGVLLGSADDVVFPAITLGSPFVLFGTPHLQAEVSSNGFVWLGANSNPDSGCCAGTGALLAAGATRICALWNDLVTDGLDGSGVYHHALPGRDVITWANAFESYDPSIRFTVQLQLINTGMFTVWYHPNTTINQIPHTGVCGVSPGGVADPGSTDFSMSFPHTSNTQSTLYEQWSVGNFDLATRTFEFAPNGLGGWLLQDRPSCPFVAGAWQTYGAGCPPQSGISGASFYELFTGANIDLDNLELELVPLSSTGYLVQPTSGSFYTGYANAVPMQDDQVVDQILPFPFVHPGGICTTAGFCSNGFVWLDNFNSAAPAAPYVPAFLFDGPRISALWTDLDLTAFGTAYFDTTPTAAVFTWLDAADFYNPSLRSTFQVQLWNDGRIKLCYQGINVGANRPILAGYGLGGAAWDPGSIDITVSLPFSSGTGVLPLVLDWTGVPPVVGRAFPLQVDLLRPTAIVGFLVLGLNQFVPGISLAPQGMPNCFQHTSVDATVLFVATPPPTAVNVLTFPANAAFAGIVLHAQAAIVDPGITPLGVQTSNGGTMTLGMF